MITIDNKYNSSNLLFSIPVHEKQDIVNNTIENIFNFNPNCKIILHINKTFNIFDENLSNYHNLYFNKTNITYNKGHDLLSYHISNFNYCINNQIEFEYFIFCASNELFIKEGAIEYIEKYKNGTQIILQNNDLNIDWHNFKKNIENNDCILMLFKKLNNNNLCGGQAEGQFYQKNIFQKICDLYLTITNNNSIYLPFEAEEIIPQTIFHSYELDYASPITLQNYTNNIEFTIEYIKQLIDNTIIQTSTIKNQLISPHLNQSSKNIYSIKRVDREFNKIRKYLSKKGFILNFEKYIYNTYYYSYNSSLFIQENNEIYFNKKLNGICDFQWFGFFVKKGNYLLNFDFKTNKFINPFYNCGLKIHYPSNYIITNIFDNYKINTYQHISIPIHINIDQNIIFIFDDYPKSFDINFKNIELKENIIIKNEKKNIILVLYKNNNNKNENYLNIKNYIIDVFQQIYNVYIIALTYTNSNNEKYILKNFYPHDIHYSKSIITFKSIIEYTKQFIHKNNIDFQFIIVSNIDMIYLHSISDLKLIINKINFLSYTTNNNTIDIDYNFCLIPNQLFNIFNNFESNTIYSFLNKNSIHYNLLINDFYYANNQIVSFQKPKVCIKNNGFLFEQKYEKHILYYNNHCFLKKMNNNHFYFFKKYTNNYQEFIWFGYNYKFNKEEKLNIKMKVIFEIKINSTIELNKLNGLNNNVGLKTHYPIHYYHDFLKNIKNNENNEFQFFEFIIEIEKKNQFIIFNFDNYLNEIELEIKNFKILIQ